MDVLPDVPVVVLVATALAAVLVLVEAALPTFGVAGTAALAFATVAVLSTGGADHPWWPLLFVVVAVVVWAVQLTVRRGHPALQAGAALAFAGGSVGYGVAAGDVATIVVAVVASVALPLVFPRLQRATRRLLDRPATTGMEALVGRPGVVVEPPAASDRPVPAGAVTVRVEGSLWTARSDVSLRPGTPVVVTGFDGLTLVVAPRTISAR